MAAPRKYPDEFRGRAVREVRSTDRPIAHIAKDLGNRKEALRGWVRQAEADHGERDGRLTAAEPGLEGVIRGQQRRTTVPEPSAPPPPDLVDRDFTASRPDQL
ncbi:transposase [Streptomyces sp. NPDC057582]|uniref:transposase n=1 Tax=Streptomyces sp. NPDC057582 TaxID=3346174 RepID=UPI0036A308EB